MVGVSKKEMEPWFNKQSINVPMSIHPDPGFVPMRRFPKDENGLVLWTASMEQFALNSHLLVFPCFWASQKANTTMAELPLWVQLSKRQEMESYLCYYFVWHICSRRALSILNRWPRILADLRTRQGEGVCHENDHQSKGTQPGLSWSLGTNITLLCFQSRPSAESAPSFGSTCRSTVRILVHQVSSVPHQWMVPSHTVAKTREKCD